MRLVIATILAIASLPAKSEGAFTAYAIGDASCGKYIAETSHNPVVRAQYSWFVAGYITSANHQKSRLVQIDHDGLDAWINQYCTARPLDPFLNAVFQLDLELDRR